MSARVVRVFLAMRVVPYREPRTHNDPRPVRHRAEWVSRGCCAVLYAGKVTTDEAEAVRLARAWLARANAPRNGHPLLRDEHARYVDTTEAPERYGYSHPAVRS